MAWTTSFLWTTVPPDTLAVPLDIVKNNQCRQTSTTVDQALLYLLANTPVWSQDHTYRKKLHQDMALVHETVFDSHRTLALLCRVVQNFAEYGYYLPDTFMSPVSVHLTYWQPTSQSPTLSCAKVLQDLREAPVASTATLCQEKIYVCEAVKMMLNTIDNTPGRVAKSYISTYLMAYLIGCQPFLIANPGFTKQVLLKANEFLYTEAMRDPIIENIMSPAFPFLVHHITGTAPLLHNTLLPEPTVSVQQNIFPIPSNSVSNSVSNASSGASSVASPVTFWVDF